MEKCIYDRDTVTKLTSYVKPNVEVLEFNYEDVIRTSVKPCAGPEGCGKDDVWNSLFNFNFI